MAITNTALDPNSITSLNVLLTISYPASQYGGNQQVLAPLPLHGKLMFASASLSVAVHTRSGLMTDPDPV